MTKKKYKTLILIIAAIFTIEVGMRLIGFILQSTHSFHNQRLNQTSVRILTIGESTTDDFWEGRPPGPWPRQLETKLRSKGYDVQVFNEGHAGYKTQIILSNLDEWLDKYQPHVVISMMGINDSGHISYIGNQNPFFDFINQIRILKLLRWTYGRVMSLRYKSLTYQSILSDELKDKYLKDYKTIGVNKLIDKVDQKLSKCDAAEIMRYITRKTEPHAGHNQMPDTMTLIEGALKRCPQNARNIFWYYAFGTKRRIDERYWCYKNLNIIQQFGTNLDSNILSSMEPCLDKPELKIKMRNLYEAKGIQVGPWKKTAIDESYEKLFEKLKSRKMAYIAMQYPTLPVDQLMDRFTGVEFSPEEIQFISNKENFENALKKHKYEEIFSDRFQGSWGHTTFLGHEMIADQLIPTIEKLYKSLKKNN